MIKHILLSTIAIAMLVACNQTQSTKQETKEKSEIEHEWKVIFDGKTFDGWHVYMADSSSDQWSIEDGAMFFNPKEGRTEAGQNLMTNKEYKNFKLSLEWKIVKGGNSGIFWGVKEDAKYKEAYETGPEIQVLDNINYADTIRNHQAGALYDMVEPSQEVVKRAGEWNKCIISIDHRLNEGKVWLNEVLIVEFSVHGNGWDTLVAKSKFKGWEGFGKFTTGKIGLQDHGDKVWYRNIKIKEL